MKKIITAVISSLTIIALMLCFTACGNEKKQEAIDVFNETSTSFNEVAGIINQNADAIDPELIKVFQEISSLLNTYSELLQGDSEISDEKYDEMIAWFKTAQEWIAQAKTEITNSVNSGTSQQPSQDDIMDGPEK